jgi:hypothetical protein
MHRLQASWSDLLLSGPSAAAEVPPTISGLAPGATACGNFLLAKAAALASASAAAPSIASIASAAFGAKVELEAVVLLPQGWQAEALEASKESEALVSRVYTELLHEQQELTHELQVTKETAVTFTT